MKCEDFNIEGINKYIDNELTDTEKQKTEEHLAECAYCRNYLDDLKRSLTVLKNKMEKEEAPERLWAGISDGMYKYKRNLLIARWSCVPALALAVMLIWGVIAEKR